MSGARPDLRQQLADERLLDALSRSELPADADGVPTWLAAWRSDLDTDIRPPEVDLDTIRPATPAPVAARLRQRWRLLVASVAAALAVAGGGGAVVAASAAARPDNPLWPVTRLVHPDRAGSRTAQLEIERVMETARQAVTDQRYDEVEGLLSDAEGLISQVREPAEQGHLRDQLSELRALIAEHVPVSDQPVAESEVDVPELPGDTPTVAPLGPPDHGPAIEPAPTLGPEPASPAPSESPAPSLAPLPPLPLPTVSLLP